MLEKSISSEESPEDAATYFLFKIAKNIQKHLKWQDSSLGILVSGINQWMLPAASMWSEANIPIQGQRIVRCFFRGHFGIPLTVPEQQVQKTFTSIIVEPSLGSATIGEGEQAIHYLYSPIDAVVSQLKETEWKEIEFKTIEIIFVMVKKYLVLQVKLFEGIWIGMW
jgi:hypothetical protein